MTKTEEFSTRDFGEKVKDGSSIFAFDRLRRASLIGKVHRIAQLWNEYSHAYMWIQPPHSPNDEPVKPFQQVMRQCKIRQPRNELEYRLMESMAIMQSFANRCLAFIESEPSLNEYHTMTLSENQTQWDWMKLLQERLVFDEDLQNLVLDPEERQAVEAKAAIIHAHLFILGKFSEVLYAGAAPEGASTLEFCHLLRQGRLDRFRKEMKERIRRKVCIPYSKRSEIMPIRNTLLRLHEFRADTQRDQEVLGQMLHDPTLSREGYDDIHSISTQKIPLYFDADRDCDQAILY